jgi:hypothetical protein
MYSNVGGCQLKHPFNKDNRQACEDAWYAKQGAKQTSAEADMLLAQAAYEQSRKGDGSWSATQTAGVLLASLAGIAILFVVIKKVGAKKSK